MKILTTIEQIAKRKKEIWELTKFQEHEISEMEDKRRKYEDRVFYSKGKLRVMKYEIDVMQKIANALHEYVDDLSEQLSNTND